MVPGNRWHPISQRVLSGVDSTSPFCNGRFPDGAKLEYICKRPYEEDKNLDPKVWECLHIAHMMECAGQFDIIHNNYDFLPLTYSRLINTPMVTTIHGFSSPRIIPVFKEYNDHNYFVSISNADRSRQLEYIATVYNGINVADFTLRKAVGEYLLYFGRIHPDKGTHEAIQIAKRFNMRLIIAGFIQDQRYYEEKVEPFLDDEIVYVGNSGPQKRDTLLGNAYALLHPISFDEPFGLSVAESMLCGTPVVAFNRGAMPELIVQEKTGFLVDTVDEAVSVLKDVRQIDRTYCRSWAEKNFSREKMVDDYIKVYRKILGK